MNELFLPQKAVNQNFKNFEDLGVFIDIKREDLLHKEVSGNKLRKLKYNLIEAQKQGHDTILTYGGAFSNHIAATAAAGKLLGLKTVGVIRGEELGKNQEHTLSNNSTLQLAQKNGMQFHFVSREAYRQKESKDFFNKMKAVFGSFYHIPEGGTNALAVKGTEEILSEFDKENYDLICVAAGTGGTAAGIINSASKHQKVIVFSALKGDFMKAEIEKYTSHKDFEVVNEDVFGGYAKSDDGLISYMNTRFRESVTQINPQGIPLEPIYTAKMLYGIEHKVKTGVIKGKTRILAIHTGGLQSIAGFNNVLEKKRRLKISYENYV
ncbi:1-aminocyclopropane-1-carboxylate deaminase [Nonlabens dokdonensis]|jgi:1-aminocyclopropane-1-carboxylate deaminase|uniref:1-aminocyclopropane-1-carboxylate deaminase n=2 Tax=Nonlabens dokdonensis TaxID=328515 RepID=A0ABX5PYN6_9FLAO|nr:pyridoxal-phosphate dependent enzyme [Nonlabens dokdonensis]AGC77338.1 putative pyridoxal phosphate-dependent enzyme, D-cysteine desulfhydrase family [Nonlabens dokdonensis DSW-6]PZX40865.1 1-aminocyclopropane-1-carboxylate deaminase [Nonlabens dokdonensis]